MCERMVQGVSIIVLGRRRGRRQRDPMLSGLVPVFEEGRQIVSTFAVVRKDLGSIVSRVVGHMVRPERLQLSETTHTPH